MTTKLGTTSTANSVSSFCLPFTPFQEKKGGHGGSIPGYRTLALYAPEYDASISLMINTDSDQMMDDIAFPLLVTLLDNLR